MRELRTYKIVIYLMVLGLTSSINAQTNSKPYNPQKDDNPILLEKIKKAVGQKESKFKLMQSRSTKETGRKVVDINWKLWEDYVEVKIFDEEKINDAQYLIDVNTGKIGFTNNRCKYTQLTNLGDEAYMCISNNKHTQILMRKRGAYVVVHSTNPIVAKRFARYVMREIEKRDRGEP